MSSVNFPNGQEVPSMPVPLHPNQVLLDQNLDPLQFSNSNRSVPNLKGIMPNSNVIGSQNPNIMTMNNTVRPLPMNNFHLQNNSNNSSRTSSPYLSQNKFSHINSMDSNLHQSSASFRLTPKSGVILSSQSTSNTLNQSSVRNDKAPNMVNSVVNAQMSAPLIPSTVNSSHVVTSTHNSLQNAAPPFNGQSQHYQYLPKPNSSTLPGKIQTQAPSYVSFPNQISPNSMRPNMYAQQNVQQMVQLVPPQSTSIQNQPPQQYNQVPNAPMPFNSMPPLNTAQNSQQQPTYVNNVQHNQIRPNVPQLTQQMGNLSIVQQGFNSLWGQETVDLMQCRNILPPEKVEAPPIKLQQHFHDAVNCNPDVFRCTMTKIPETNNLLQKSRLPLGVLIHPFRDLNHLPVIQCSTIVRCRACRTYINPFVYFVDSKKWKCNLCYRVNELPEEFQYDPVSKSYGDPSRRPEVKSATIEFIAPSEYMLRPPQPAVYLFLLDTSRLAVESGYLNIVCKQISAHLDELPGDTRMQVGIICFNSQVHFYNMAEGLTRPHEITVIDVKDMFLPCPENLVVNLLEQKTLFKELLSQLPHRFTNNLDNGSALGAALQAAYKLIFATGGRVTVFQTCLPNIGPGALTSREDPNDRSSSHVSHLGPATDFYKRLALDCSGQQIAVDLFLLNSQYSDLATLSGISRFSGGCMYHLPLFKADRAQHADQLSKMFARYLTRKIGFEAVMRVRCTRGMSIHTFHGNFFVRSTDLLSLPNVNPDAGFGMQLSIDESLQDAQTVCLQAALLYTSSKGERRIRVHTLCLPVSSSLSEIMFGADAQCIVGLLAKMAVDRSLQSSLTDARDAFINVCVDALGAFRATQNLPNGYQSHSLCVPEGLKLLPLYIHALMKHVAFRVGTSTRLDDRIFAMCEMKSLPLDQLIKQIYPNFYPLHYLNEIDNYDLEKEVPTLPRLQLTAEKLDSNGVFLLDSGPIIFIYVGGNCSPNFLRTAFGVPSIMEIQDISHELPVISTKQNEAIHAFIKSLNDEKPYAAVLNIIRDNGPYKNMFTEKLVDDRMENSLSYYEFLQHLKTNVK